MAQPAKKSPPRKRPGRPPVHDRETVGHAICAKIATGMLVKDACAEHGITSSKIWQWAADDAEFRKLYARAREDQAHAIAEEAITIANGDDSLTLLREEAVDGYEDELRKADDKHWYQKVQALRAGVINRDKMRVDARKWLASKIAPKQYGERQEIVGDGGGPLVVSVRVAREGRRVTAG